LESLPVATSGLGWQIWRGKSTIWFGRRSDWPCRQSSGDRPVIVHVRYFLPPIFCRLAALLVFATLEARPIAGQAELASDHFFAFPTNLAPTAV
jgi:hypothetical protein